MNYPYNAHLLTALSPIESPQEKDSDRRELQQKKNIGRDAQSERGDRLGILLPSDRTTIDRRRNDGEWNSQAE